MGLFDRWRRSGRRSQISRELLFQAANAEKLERFTELCAEHAEWIVANFKSWTNVPAEIRAVPDAVQAYAKGLIMTARTIAANGRPELLEMIMPKDDDNPLARWPAKLTSARQLLASGDTVAAQTAVEGVIREMEPCAGPGVDEYLPKAWGILGEIRFRNGEHESAQQATARALELCRRSGDHEGTVVYCGNLAEIARARGDRVAYVTWLGEGIEAAQAAGLKEHAAELQSRLQSGSERQH